MQVIDLFSYTYPNTYGPEIELPTVGSASGQWRGNETGSY